MKPLTFLRDAVRAKEILGTLVAYGFDEIIHGVEPPVGWLGKIVPAKKTGLTTWQRIRLVCEDLGPTFVKIGQVLSARPDLLPEPLLAELKRLRSQVRPEPFDKIRPHLERELNDTIENVFAHFDPEPRASGSMAQVYYARLRTSQAEVAVKMQRPGIDRSIQADMEILGWLARELHTRLEAVQPYDLPAVADELRRGLVLELNFTREARHAEIFNAGNPYPGEIYAPKPVAELITRKLLIAEWVHGISLDKAVLEPGAGPKYAQIGARSVFHQIVIQGFFHGDPHTGNMLVAQDGRLCLLDWGLAGQLTRHNRYYLSDLFAAVIERNVEQAARIAMNMHRGYRYVDEQRIEKQIAATLDKYGPALAQEDIGKVMFDLLFVLGSNGITVMRDYTILAKAIFSVSQTARSLDASFDLRTVAQPYLRQLALERWNPSTILRQIGWNLQTSLRQMQQLPGDLQRVLRRVENEDLTVNLRHQGFERFEAQATSAINRLVFAIIVGSLIIGSSMVIHSNLPPLVWGSYPIVGVAGYFGSAILGLWIVFDILRHGRHK